jgi:hypothetical protein
VLHPPRFLRYVPSDYAFIASSRLVSVRGLKPAGINCSIGTTEVVPFQIP